MGDSYGYPLTNTTSGYYTTPMTPMYVSSGSSYVYSTPVPILPPVREPTSLEWLDAEVERTCAKARLAA